MDLTRKGGEECVLNPASLDALRMVTSPGWYPAPGAADPGLQYSETSPSDAVLQVGPQIQPDNAFSQTTVTLSYVSRSHVFSPHDSLSHSPLYSMPPISKFSLHPSCDSDKGLAEGGFALGQRYLVEAAAPVDQTGLLQSLPQAAAEECPEQECRELNGEVVCSDGDSAQCVQGEEEHDTSLKNNQALEKGQGESWSSSGVCIDSSPETLTPVTGEEEGPFVMSKTGGPGVGSESAGAGDLCPISGEYRSPLEDPASPSATSLDDVEDLFVLPQASCSPRGDHSCPEEAVCDGSSTEGDAQLSSGSDEGTPGATLDSSQKNKQQARRRKALFEPLIDLTDDICLSDLSENNTKTVVPHVNGNTKTLDRTLKGRKLPVRSGRGTRLEAIVMNINSSKYKVSGCIRSNKKANASQPTGSDSSLPSPKRKARASAGEQTGNDRAPFTVTTQRTRTRRGQANHCKASTSHSKNITNSNKLPCCLSPKRPRLAAHARPKREAHPVTPPPPATPLKPKRKPSSLSSSPLAGRRIAEREPEVLPHSQLSEEIQPARLSPPPPPPPPPPLPVKSPKKSQGKAKSKSPCSKTSPTAKTKALCTPRRRRRKKPKQHFSPSMFSPKEPEIKLKYVSYKEEKRDPRLDSFSPFIRVERQQATPSLCTLINYPDEVKAPHGKAQQQHHPQTHSGFISAAVPSTSCLLLGRVSMHSLHQRSLVCCICGRSANAMDLGDLHGPYYPEGYQPNTKAPADAAGLKEEEDYSDSDSSSYSLRGCGRKSGTLPAPRTLRPGAQLKHKRVHADHHRWCGDSTSGPAAKRARSDPASTANVEDWYSPPVLPMEPREYWLHEDCCIWSAGVFLVKGKVYGLEEAVKAALQTVCSACHHPGATLGCFFKGCPNKYHYRCALESADCVLIEENFSMKCKKHKNKTFKGAPGKRPDVS